MQPADSKLRGIFLTELDERVLALERDLIALERTNDDAAGRDLVKALFRSAHSLKGAAAAADVEPIVHACHRLEEVFVAVRDGRQHLAGDAFRLFFAAVDAIADAGRRLRAGETLDPAPLSLLLPQRDTEVTLSPAPAPEPAPARGLETGRERREAAAVVRVAAAKLDALLARSGLLRASTARSDGRIGELAALRALIGDCCSAVKGAAGEQLLRRLNAEAERFHDQLATDRRMLLQAATALHEEVRRLRMLPLALACEGFERVVRDLCAATGKEAALVLVGGTIELDRAIVERLRDLLLHLVRNAVDHGIEPAPVRRAAGKPEVGQITIAASLSGPRIEISVTDDGGGLDLDRIAARARAQGLPPAAGRELARYVFLPGFSTLAAATRISGRGVGLDVVRTGVEDMRGSVEVSFEPGRSTRFVLDLPLTLTTIHALIVTAGWQSFALDAADVARLLRTSPAELAAAGGSSVLVLEDGPVPVVELAALLGIAAASPATRASLPLVIVAAEGKRIALLVDDYVDDQEIMVRPLGRRFARLPHIAGGTFLPGGRMGLILNVRGLMRTAYASAPAPIAAKPDAAAPAAAARVLLADDSLTTRSLERSILEVAGYEVIAAADGEEAWRLLQENGADIVVSDVEMPRMDGFALTAAIRGSRQFADVPVILVTARASDADRLRGLEAGASAYLVKSAFDQQSLLDAIGQFL